MNLTTLHPQSTEASEAVDNPYDFWLPAKLDEGRHVYVLVEQPMAKAPHRKKVGTTGSVQPETDLVSFRTEVEQRLKELEQLGPNWDRQGAQPVPKVIIDAIRRFVQALRTVPSDVRPLVVPSAEGTVQLEWTDGPRALELEFEGESTIRYLKWWPQRGIEEEDTFSVGDIDRADELIRWFIEGRNVR